MRSILPEYPGDFRVTLFERHALGMTSQRELNFLATVRESPAFAVEISDLTSGK